MTEDEELIVAKLEWQGCVLETTSPLSMGFRYKDRRLWLSREGPDGYTGHDWSEMVNELERWDLELLPLDR